MGISEEIKKLEKKPLIKRSAEEIDVLVKDLMAKMTLEEKIGQLSQTFYYSDVITGPMFEAHDTIKLIKEGKIGSILNCTKIETVYSLQKYAVNNTRLGIPLMFMLDVIHGFYTSFPTPLAMSSSFDIDLVRKTAEISAYECLHNGINVTFSPMVDIVRDSRWGRVNESNGEDIYLSRLLTKAYVQGYQKDSLSRLDSIGAVCKHYIGYGLVEAGREYNNVDVSNYLLRSKYLPPFIAALEEDVLGVMTSFNPVNGVPMTCNKHLTLDVLKEELGFKGFTICDYNAVKEIVYHKVAKDDKEACKLAIEAELDQEMVSTCYSEHLLSLCKEEPSLISHVDNCCYRILSAKYRLGLFDDPYKNIYADPSTYFMKEEFKEVSKKIASESLLLLKNDNILPLKKGCKLFAYGPYLNSKEVVGPWGGIHNLNDNISVLEGLKKLDSIEVITHDDYLKGSKEADVILLLLGETSFMSGEGGSRVDISLTREEENLIEEISKVNPNIILVTFSGRPLVLTNVLDKVKGLLSSFYLGMFSGEVISETLVGLINPSARVTMSFPRSVGQLPISYDAYPTGRPKADSKEYFRFETHYIDCLNTPLFPFGYGLSYNEYEYSNLRLSKKEIRAEDDFIEVSIDVENKGSYEGDEIVQLYIEALSFSVTRPYNELKGFKREHFKAHEKKTLVFKVGVEELKGYNTYGMKVIENVDFKIKVGKSSFEHLEDIIKVEIN